jgi:ligand-binding SRPBCC domain-containing protein
MSLYQRSFEVHAPLTEVAAFHDDPASLTGITPPPVRVTIERFDAPVHAGSQIVFTLHVGPIGVQWQAGIVEYAANRYFRDIQVSGPFGAWTHTHTFTASADVTIVSDRVEYQPPLGRLGKWLDPIVVRPALAYLFRFRARKTRQLLEQHSRQVEISHA